MLNNSMEMTPIANKNLNKIKSGEIFDNTLSKDIMAQSQSIRNGDNSQLYVDDLTGNSLKSSQSKPKNKRKRNK